MAGEYIKQVVWDSPYTNQFLPVGRFGMKYTIVNLDVPLDGRSREVWLYSETFRGADTESESTERVTFFTSVHYEPDTLKLFANGQEVEIIESDSKDRYEVEIKDIVGRYLYNSYIPKDLSYSIGDNRVELEKIFDVITSVNYSQKLRITLHRMREYISRMREVVNLSPILWIGGVGNNEIGNFQPGLTATDTDLHLKTIKDAAEELVQAIVGLGYQNILLPPTVVEYSVDFLEGIQRSLTQSDEGLFQLSEEGKV